MRLRVKIAVAALSLAVAGCRELPDYFVGDRTLARVARVELQLSEVASVAPEGVTGEDSAAFVKLYVDRWVRRRLKLREAEELFSDAAADIEQQVEAYRQALLIRKLERYCVDREVDTVFTEKDIAAYYDAHKEDFRLDGTLVKGRILRFAEGYRQSKKLLELMGSPQESRQKELRDLCEKNDFTMTDFTGSWVDFQEFLSYLPTLRSQSYDPVLASSAVQQMRDSHSHYYFQITGVRRAGEPIPLERLRPTIRRILFNQRQNEVIRRYEEEVYARGVEEKEVKIYDCDTNE